MRCVFPAWLFRSCRPARSRRNLQSHRFPLQAVQRVLPNPSPYSGSYTQSQLPSRRRAQLTCALPPCCDRFRQSARRELRFSRHGCRCRLPKPSGRRWKRPMRWIPPWRRTTRRGCPRFQRSRIDAHRRRARAEPGVVPALPVCSWAVWSFVQPAAALGQIHRPAAISLPPFLSEMRHLPLPEAPAAPSLPPGTSPQLRAAGGVVRIRRRPGHSPSSELHRRSGADADRGRSHRDSGALHRLDARPGARACLLVCAGG